mmetsp:Transcript_15686/g.28524  ORF Transcript_15686/g.28524 Transcript_15686/m.28524 type:complete len:95 (-) Transcript_15686:850-1134(-)
MKHGLQQLFHTDSRNILLSLSAIVEIKDDTDIVPSDVVHVLITDRMTPGFLSGWKCQEPITFAITDSLIVLKNRIDQRYARHVKMMIRVAYAGL